MRERIELLAAHQHVCLKRPWKKKEEKKDLKLGLAPAFRRTTTPFSAAPPPTERDTHAACGVS
jgi:hypothetical protein